MHNHTGCICLTFLHCVFLNVSSNYVHKRMQNHTGNICWIFLHCVLSNVSSKHLDQSMHSHTGCICLTFQMFPQITRSRILLLFDFSSMCVSKRILKLPAQADTNSHWLHLFDFSVCFHIVYCHFIIFKIFIYHLWNKGGKGKGMDACTQHSNISC